MHGSPGLRKFPARWLSPCLGLGIAMLGADSAQSQTLRPDTTGTIVGFVTSREAELPLPYSVVSITVLGREQFTNDRGVFTLAGLPAGTHKLRVRHLGYTPANMDITVRAGFADTVRVSLAHIVVQLTPVRVRAYAACTNPGAPRAADDSAFATVFDQLRQNAEQYRLLTRAYPFVYGVERTTGVAYARNIVRRERVDTIALRGSDEWRYAPGRVVSQSRFLFVRGAVTMHIPTLEHFADSVFIANHCFHNGGLETVDGRDLLRVDFVAADRIRDPDVDGSMYLDPATFQIRRTFLRLTRAPRAIPDLEETEATTLFAELLPSVPIVAAISSVNRLKPVRNRINPPTGTTEDQRLIAVEFIAGRPGDVPRRP
jgi:hypothetical protein